MLEKGGVALFMHIAEVLGVATNLQHSTRPCSANRASLRASYALYLSFCHSSCHFALTLLYLHS